MQQALYAETYVTSPDHPWLVFLHGFGGSTQMFRKQLSCFRERFNLLLLDLPGHGRSRSGIAERGIRRFEDVADMVAETLKKYNIEKACFVCVSLGTLVYAALQNKYPELVHGAILCGAVAGVNLAWRGLLAVLDRLKHRFPHRFLLWAFAWVLLPRKSHAKSRRFFIESGKLLTREEFLAWFSLIVQDMNVLKDTAVEQLQNVTFISGTEDFTFIKGVKELVSAAKDVRLTLLRRCGHVCSLQRPQEFNDLSLEFLSSLGIDAAATNHHTKETDHHG